MYQVIRCLDRVIHSFRSKTTVFHSIQSMGCCRCFRPFSPYEWLPHRLPFSRLIPQLSSRLIPQLSSKLSTATIKASIFLHTLRHPYSHLFGHAFFKPHTSHLVKLVLVVVALGAASLLFSSSTQADAQWVMVNKAQSTELQLSVSQEKVRFDLSDQPNQFGLFDGRTNTLYWINSEAKEYQSWKQPLAFVDSDEAFSSQATGRKTIAGINCRLMEIQRGKIPVDQICVAAPEAVGLSKQEASTFRRFVRSLAQLELAMTTSNTLDNIASLAFSPQLNLPSSPKPRWTINEPSQPNSVLRSSSNWGQDGGRRTLASDLPPDGSSSGREGREESTLRLSPPRLPFSSETPPSDNLSSGKSPFPSDIGGAWLAADGIPLSLRNLSSGERWQIRLDDTKALKREDFNIPSDFQLLPWNKRQFSQPQEGEALELPGQSSPSSSTNRAEERPLNSDTPLNEQVPGNDQLPNTEPAWPEASSSSGFRMPEESESSERARGSSDGSLPSTPPE